ncbi:MAG: phosphotransferase [Gammaproteobacteria bacterium]|jgi:aminoglycoside phosphotransferase (APT) family kinase protein|nr:phosphotransferase [Gammaproteobacteria bacterium]
MGNIWDKTTQITSALAQELIKSQFSIEIEKIQLFGEGFDNTAFLVNNEYVFRFPHRIEALVCMENEILLLPYLSQKMSFMISSPTMIGKPSASYPYPFAGYEILSGELLSISQTPLVDNTAFAKILGTWLRELHTLPVLNEHIKHLKGEHEWRLDFVNRKARVNECITKYADYFINYGFDIQRLITIMDYFKGVDIHCSNKCYLHGDLYSKHIVVDHSGLPMGLIDWGDVHIGHPAVDIAVGLMIFTKERLKDFLAAYQGIDSTTMKVAIFRAYSHSILAFSYFAQIEEKSTIEWTKAALINTISLVDKPV